MPPSKPPPSPPNYQQIWHPMVWLTALPSCPRLPQNLLSANASSRRSLCLTFDGPSKPLLPLSCLPHCERIVRIVCLLRTRQRQRSHSLVERPRSYCRTAPLPRTTLRRRRERPRMEMLVRRQQTPTLPFLIGNLNPLQLLLPSKSRMLKYRRVLPVG